MYNIGHDEMEPYFVDVIVADDAITFSVEIIEELNHLKRCDQWTDLGEAHNIREVNGHTVIQFCFDAFSSFQALSYAPAMKIGDNFIPITF